MLDRKLFDNKMFELMEHFCAIIDEKKIATYWRLLSEMTNKEFTLSVDGVLKTFKPFPNKPFPMIADFFDNKPECCEPRIIKPGIIEHRF